MATPYVWKNAKVEIDDSAGSLVNLSAQVESVTLNVGYNTDVVNGMGDDTEVNTVTIKNWSVDVTFVLNFGTGSVEEQLYEFYNTQAATNGKTIQITKDAASGASATNPVFSGEAILDSYPIGGDFGSNPRVTVTFMCAGDLTRTVA